MELNHKHKAQVNFTNLNTAPIQEETVINRPIELCRGKRSHQSLSNASGERELRVINETT